ncbi:MAG: NAD-dependent epimerase/dehydratase family protein [Clostridia bacterium]|nr:NAD-dependent epimerase/dehydratase family protein [Clostridia bacterium]
MKILVLGGTGAMGIHLIKLLENNGVEVFVTTRRQVMSHGAIRYIQGNARNLDFLKGLLSEHWDAIVDFMSYSTEEFRNRVSLLLNATEQYLFLSSSRVYANSEIPIREDQVARLLDISDDSEFLSTDEYSLAKARQENILQESGRKNWTIIRPYITFAENRLQLGVLEKEEWLYRVLHGRSIVFSEEMLNKLTTLTYGADVALGIKSVIGKADAFGECFHITQNESLSWQEVLDCYLSVLKERVGCVPKLFLAREERFLKFHPAKYQVRYDRFYDRRFDSSKIEKFANVGEFTPTRAGLEKCICDFLKEPRFLPINWVLEAKKDKFTGESTPLSEILSIRSKLKYILVRWFPAGEFLYELSSKGINALCRKNTQTKKMLK